MKGGRFNGDPKFSWLLAMLVWVVNLLVLPATQAVPPPNDQFANSLLVTGDTLMLSGDVAEATTESGEPDVPDAAGHSLWWTWRSEKDGVIQLSGLGYYSLFEGETISSLRLIRTGFGYTPPPDDLPTFSAQNLFSFIPVRAGVTYQIRLDSNPCTFQPAPPVPWGFNCLSMGTALKVRLSFQLGASDSFEGRRSVSSESPSFFALNEYASRQSLEPPSPSGAGLTVWWSWTVPETGRYEMAGNFPVVDVFRGNQLDQLEPVATQRVARALIIYAWGTVPGPTFVARKGETLVIRGDSLAATATNLQINFDFKRLLPPQNDAFADAFAITNGPAGAVSFIETDLTGGTPEFGESLPAARSAWWRWSPSATGAYVLERPRRVLSGPLLGRPRMEVLYGERLSDLAKVAELNPDADSTRFSAEAGVAYWIKLDQLVDSDIMLARFRVLPIAPNDDPSFPLDIREGPERVRVVLDGSGILPWETWATSSRSVWLRWRAPASGYLSIRSMTSEQTTFALGPENGFTNRSPQIGNSWFFKPATFPVAAGMTYLIAAYADDLISGELPIQVDFTSWRILRPFDGEVFPDGTSELSTEVASGDGTTEYSIIGVSWELQPLIAGPAWPVGSATAQILSKNAAVLSDVPSGVWQLRVKLTNEYGGEILLPPVRFRLPPSNDSLSGAVKVSDLPWSSSPISTAGAGLEAGEPMNPKSAETNRVWWTWTPSLDAVVVVSGKGNAVAAFAGNEIGSLQPVGSSDFRPLRIEAHAGQPLAFRVTPNPMRFWTLGTVEFELRPQLPGDDFSDRIALPSDGGPFLMPVGPSSAELGEPPGKETSSLPSLWWHWVPPDNGTLLLHGASYVRGQEVFVSTWRAFEGGTLGTLTELPSLVWLPGTSLEGAPMMPWESAAFTVRRGVPVQIAGEMVAYSHPEVWSRLEFVPDPAIGQMGVPTFADPNPYDPKLMFPVGVESGDTVVIEGSRDLGVWEPYWSIRVDHTGTYWLGPINVGQGGTYYRVNRTAFGE